MADALDIVLGDSDWYSQEQLDAARAEVQRLRADSAALARVREVLAGLDEKAQRATRIPWRSIRAPMQPEYRCVVFDKREEYATSPLLPADADLIVLMSQALPSLLAATSPSDAQSAGAGT